MPLSIGFRKPNSNQNRSPLGGIRTESKGSPDCQLFPCLERNFKISQISGELSERYSFSIRSVGGLDVSIYCLDI